MKCGYCNGTGEHINDANRMTTCEFCGGTGIIKPLTNEEWRRICSAEEFAKWMAQYCCDVNTRDVKEILKNEWLEWLKEKHTE